MSETVGKRIEWGETGPIHPGEYAKGPDGNWYGETPNGHGCNLSAHQVTEHEDGTITVAPSILVWLPANDEQPRRELWHGYLERGVWREC